MDNVGSSRQGVARKVRESSLEVESAALDIEGTWIAESRIDDCGSGAGGLGDGALIDEGAVAVVVVPAQVGLNVQRGPGQVLEDAAVLLIELTVALPGSVAGILEGAAAEILVMVAAVGGAYL